MSLPLERKGRLTASNFAAAMGLNPYMSRQKLYRQLMGLEPKFEGNEMTQWGQDHEQDAVDAYEAEMGVICTKTGDEQEFVIRGEPALDWMGCTPDGYNGRRLIECKCPYSQNLYDSIPDYYMPQIQGQMTITGCGECDFVCWTPNDLAVWRVYFDETYSELMVTELLSFYETWKAGKEPKRTKKPVMPEVKIERII